MRENRISPNARKAYDNFKEEIANELGIRTNSVDVKKTRKKVNKAEDYFTHLGRS